MGEAKAAGTTPLSSRAILVGGDGDMIRPSADLNEARIDGVSGSLTKCTEVSTISLG